MEENTNANAEETVKEPEAKPAAETAAEETAQQPEAAQAETSAEEPAKEPEKPAEEPAKEAEKPAAPAEPDWKDLYARLRADFDNYKKRAARDREDVYRYAEGDILKDVIPTVDNLQLALSNFDKLNPKTSEAGEESTNRQIDESTIAFVKGVQMVLASLLKALKDHGAEPFDSVGLELDTEKMEAIANLPSPDVEEGKVSIESKKGWTLKGKVLRAAQVVVSAGAAK